jgi:hypothetical protein
MPTTLDIDALLRLWTEPLPAGDAAQDAIRVLYTDPVKVNGNWLTAADLVARVIALQQAIETPDREVLDVADAGGKIAVAFRLTGRHVGPLGTAAGVLPPTGEMLTLRVIDILTLVDGRISEIVMVADELGALNAIGAVSLQSPVTAG